MASAYDMQFPFTTRNEILAWEKHYCEKLSESMKALEPDVINIKEEVRARKTNETPAGYLLKTELREMGRWKYPRTLPKLIDKNQPEDVEKITAEAFSLQDDWEKLKKLISYNGGLHGVGESVASVILHLYDSEKEYPILDVHALSSVGIKEADARGPKYPFWQEYVLFCRDKAEKYKVSMRTLDRALYKYSQSGGVTAMEIIADKTLFRELKCRGYTFPKLHP